MRVHTPGITKATIAMATTLGTHPTFISSNGVKYLRSLEYAQYTHRSSGSRNAAHENTAHRKIAAVTLPPMPATRVQTGMVMRPATAAPAGRMLWNTQANTATMSSTAMSGSPLMGPKTAPTSHDMNPVASMPATTHPTAQLSITTCQGLSSQ